MKIEFVDFTLINLQLLWVSCSIIGKPKVTLNNLIKLITS